MCLNDLLDDMERKYITKTCSDTWGISVDMFLYPFFTCRWMNYSNSDVYSWAMEMFHKDRIRQAKQVEKRKAAASSVLKLKTAKTTKPPRRLKSWKGRR